ncbi:MAG: hypothetical protein GXP01_05475 [Alphaproteobacteria bacterium]|nr:hypothetical protein [Alphaproteobacteria bacterium]
MSGSRRLIGDGAVLWAVRIWCYGRYPLLVSKIYRAFRRWPDPALPRTVFDKFFWRRLFDHNPRWPDATDKLKAKQYVQRKFPHIGTAKVLWQGTDPAQIPDEILHRQAVIKPNNASGRQIFLDGGPVDRQKLEATCAKWMSRSYGRTTGEWAYGPIEPKLFVEELVTTTGGQTNGSVDRIYDVYVCHGKVIYCFVLVGAKKQVTDWHVFDRAGVSYSVNFDGWENSTPAQTPEHWDRIVHAAEALGARFDMVRCDLFENDGKIWFVENTLYSLAGLCWIGSPEIMDRLNRKWELRRTWFLRHRHRGWRAIYATVLRRALVDTPRAAPEHNIPVTAIKAHPNV